MRTTTYRLTFRLSDGNEAQRTYTSNPRDDAAAIRQGCHQALKDGAYLLRVEVLHPLWRREVIWRREVRAAVPWWPREG